MSAFIGTIFYFVLAYYTYIDTQKRKMKTTLWVILQLILPFIGIIIYLFARKNHSKSVDKISFLPYGFRSNNKTKKIIASLGYFIFFLVIFVGALGSGIEDKGDKSIGVFQDNLESDKDVSENTKTEENNQVKDNIKENDNILNDSQNEDSNNNNDNQQSNSNKTNPDNQDSTTNTTTDSNKPTSDKIEVHYIDVGQADSILIKDGNSAMLIDGGNNGDSDLVVNYINKLNITKLDYVIGTHPHEDHIGGLDAVINNFEVGQVIMPKVSHTSNTYADVLTALKNKSLKITAPLVGSKYNLENSSFTILAPNGSNYSDLNNYSVVIKLVHNNTSFLFTGDAENISEDEMINNKLNLSSTVLKLGHHGSHSSTSLSFLNKVNPKYAVISVGENNIYDHPHKETLDRLKSKNIPVYRTDESGTIIATSDGSKVTFNTKPGSYKAKVIEESSDSSNTKTPEKDTTQTPPSSNTGEKIYVDANGKGLIKGNISSKGEKIYHLPDGMYYSRTDPEAWFKTESEAKAAGYRASLR